MTKSGTVKDAGRGPTTSAAWRATVADVEAQIAAAASEAAEIDARRGSLALRAQLGDADAQALLDAQNGELEALYRHRRDLERAAAEARTEIAAAEVREAAALRARNERAAEKLIREAREIAERLDGAIAKSAADARELERRLVRAAHLRGGNSARVGERVERAVRAAYWNAELKLGDYVRPSWRASLVEGLGGMLDVAAEKGCAA